MIPPSKAAPSKAEAAPKAKVPPVPSARVPSEDDIRAYAYHLYTQGSREPGHDLDNWLEAKACLASNIPTHRSEARLHHHVHGS